MNSLIQNLLSGYESSNSGTTAKSEASQNQPPESVAFTEVLKGVIFDEQPREPMLAVSLPRDQADVQTETGDPRDRPAGDAVERSRASDSSINPKASVISPQILAVMAAQPPQPIDASPPQGVTSSNATIGAVNADSPAMQKANLGDGKDAPGAVERLDTTPSYSPPNKNHRAVDDGPQHISQKSSFPVASGYSEEDASSPPIKATVKSLQSHLAAAVSDFSVQTQKSLPQGQSGHDAYASVGFLETPQHYSFRSPVKIITIELTPASLGQITAKMKFSGAGLALELNVETPEARRALRDVENSLVEAIHASGGKVESCEIRISSAQGSTDTVPESSQNQDASASFDNRSSANDAFLDSSDRRGERPGGRGFPDGPEKTIRPSVDRESASPIDMSAGVYL